MEQLSWLPDEATQFALSLSMDEVGRWHWRVAYGTLERGFRDEWRVAGSATSCRDAAESMFEIVCQVRLSSL